MSTPDPCKACGDYTLRTCEDGRPECPSCAEHCPACQGVPSRVVVGIEQHGDDWTDAWGHYWAWDAGLGRWTHDRDRCTLSDGVQCQGRAS